MGTETVVRNSGSATGSITCPKCGYAQEERLDCRKCGIIFSKYYALHPPDKSAEGKGIENSNPQEPSSQELKLLVSDIQLQIRDITAKFSETEFEKAERNRLQKELKELDQKFQSSLEELTARLEGYEKRL